MGRVRRLARVSSRWRRRRACRSSSRLLVEAGSWEGRYSAYLCCDFVILGACDVNQSINREWKVGIWVEG
jgi:hypothetical protein